MLTIIKNYIDGDKSQKRINIKKMTSLRELIIKQIKNITFKFDNIEDIHKLKKLSLKDGETEVKILLQNHNEIKKFYLKDKRKVNYDLLNTLNLENHVRLE